MGLKGWLLKRYIKRQLRKLRQEDGEMTKIKAFFSGLFDTKASEFYAGWAGIAMKALLLIPAAGPVIGVLNYVASFVGLGTAEVLVGTLLTYAAARMTKKAVSA